jgi:hypothetical protein
MIFLTERIRSTHRIEVIVYDSLEDLSQRVDWQDVLGDSLRILDEEGQIHIWDHSKKEEVGTVFKYSFKTNGRDLELAEKCKRLFVQLGKPRCFEIEIDDSINYRPQNQ